MRASERLLEIRDKFGRKVHKIVPLELYSPRLKRLFRIKSNYANSISIICKLELQ